MFERETAARCERNSDRRIEMRERDVKERVKKNNEGESKNDGDTRKSNGFVVLGVYSHRCTTGEYQKVRSKNLRHQLKT